jgi:hypothetical protein
VAATRSDGNPRSIERWLIRRGVPHFIDGYSASEDVLTRTLPVLTLTFLFEMLAAANLDWPWWANLLSVAGGFAILIAGWALTNAARGRPAFQRPDRVGLPEVAVFVLVPALLPLVFGGEWDEAAWLAGANLVLLAVVYGFTSYGVIPMARWAAGQLIRQLGDTLGLFTRALPLLLIAFLFLFINAEVWQVAGTLETVPMLAVLGLFLALGAVFIITRLPRELRPLATFATAAEIERHVAGTPAEGITAPDPVAVPDPSVRQWGNAGLVMVVTQALRVTTAAVLIGAFFVLFGVLTMQPGTIETWTTEPANAMASFELFGRPMALTEELLRVAAFLAGFSAFYFTVYLVTDPTFREEFFSDVEAELRRSFAVRAASLASDGTAESAARHAGGTGE